MGMAGKWEKGIDFWVTVMYNENMRNRPRKKMGRPPKPPERRRREFIGVHCTSAERRRLEHEAKRLGLSISELLMLPWRQGK